MLQVSVLSFYLDKTWKPVNGRKNLPEHSLTTYQIVKIQFSSFLFNETLCRNSRSKRDIFSCLC